MSTQEKICLVFEKVRKGSEKRLKARLGPKGLRTGHRITSMNKCDKVCDKVSPVPYCVVLKEGNLVSSAAMGRWPYPPPPVPAVPPSQTNDCKGFLRFKPS